MNDELPAFLRPAKPLLHSASDMANMLRVERRRTRKANRVIWAVSMVITVAIAASVRRQQFEGLGELAWYWPAIAGVSTNFICTWLGGKMMFSGERK